MVDIRPISEAELDAFRLSHNTNAGRDKPREDHSLVGWSVQVVGMFVEREGPQA